MRCRRSSRLMTSSDGPDRRHARGRRARSGSSYRSQTIRGSLRNHPSWRRANRRVANTVRSRASSSGELAAQVGDHLAVADRDRARCGPRPARRRAAARPRRRSRCRTSRPPAARSAASRVGRSMSTPIWTVCGSAYSRVGSDGAVRPPGELDDLEGADRSGGRSRAASASAASGSSVAQPVVAARRAHARRARPPAARGPRRRCAGNSNRSRIARV